jgi:hypothetical protein
MLFYSIVIIIIFGIIAAIIGDKKGQGLFGLFLGILLGPLGVLIMLTTKGNRKNCPYCKELIHKNATRCSHCQKELS